jgi:arginyl-tRNA synthetase
LPVVKQKQSLFSSLGQKVPYSSNIPIANGRKKRIIIAFDRMKQGVMKSTVEQLIKNALALLQEQHVVPNDAVVDVTVERTKEASHGDYATNIALVLAKPARQSPRKLAELILPLVSNNPLIDRVEIAGPGFINFFMKNTERLQII